MISTTNSRFGQSPYVLQDGPHRLLDTGNDFMNPITVSPVTVGVPMVIGIYDEGQEQILLPDTIAIPTEVGSLDPDE